MNFLLLQIVSASVWFFCSAIIDFVAIPTVFRELKTVADGVVLGGQIGVNVFRQFNIFEVLLALSLLGFTLAKKDCQSKLDKSKVIISSVLVVIALTYAFYLSPNITSAHKIIATPGVLPGVLEGAQEKLDTFHRSYVTVEKIKVSLLLALTIIQAFSWTKSLNKMMRNS